MLSLHYLNNKKIKAKLVIAKNKINLTKNVYFPIHNLKRGVKRVISFNYKTSPKRVVCKLNIFRIHILLHLFPSKQSFYITGILKCREIN